jgi:hypothetical protein
MRRWRGCNWFPSWARSPVDHWAVGCPRDALDRELGFIAGLGLDHARIWLSAEGWERDPTAYTDNLRFLLDEAEAHGVGVVMELFDSCGVEPSTGPATTVRIEEVPALAAGDSRLVAVGDRDVFGKPGLVPVPWRGDPLVALWEGWVPNPGYDVLGPSHWGRWDAFAASVTGAVAPHPALVALELMNEPFASHLGQPLDRRPIIEFYRHVHDVVRPLAPDVPLSIGASAPGWFAEHEANVGQPFDFVSVHSLAGPAALEATIAAAEQLAGGRPVYLSEWGYYPGGDDGEQLADYERLMPILESTGVGWAVSHLIAGYGPFGNTALLYPSGVMRPAALYLRTRLRQTHAARA